MSNKSKLKASSQFQNFEDTHNTLRLKIYASAGLILLLIIAFFVTIVFPNQLAQKKNLLQKKSKEKFIQKEALNKTALESQAKEIETVFQNILKLQARLENEGIKMWGSELFVTNYDEVLMTLAQANNHKIKENSDQVLMSYRKALKELKQIETSRPQRIQRALKTAKEAFGKYNSVVALKQYQIVLAADAGNKEAQAGLQRAENLPKVLKYIQKGEIYEKNNNWDLAREMYSKAVLLDKKFQIAENKLKRINNLIEEKNFQISMTNSISALNQKDFKTAKNAFNLAQKLRPNAKEVHNLNQQLKNMELRIELKRLKKEALELEGSEDWGMANKIYDNILEIDPNAGFALEGKQRSEKSFAFMHAVQKYISNPEKLQEPEHLNYARKISEMSITQDNVGPKLRENINKLKNLLALYVIPVSILVKSDEMTNVRIYRIGSFGRFLEHRLMLKPGQYKAQGVRSGYRDVIVSFSVPVSSEEIVLEVSCKEKI